MAVCLLLSAFYSGSESAFISLTPAQLERLRKQRNLRSRLVYSLCQNTPVLLTTVLIGNNLMNVILTVLASSLTIRLSGSALLGVTTAILTLGILIFGEIYPKQLAIRYNERWARWAIYPIYGSKYLFIPLTALIQLLTSLMPSSKEESNQVTRDNLLQQIHVATGLGVLKRHTAQVLINTLRFSSEPAEVAMTHRTQVVSITRDTTPAAALALITRSGFSRIPVYDTDPERIVGIVLLKDLLRIRNDPEQPNDAEQRGYDSVAAMMQPPLFVSQAMRLDRVLLQMRRNRQHMAIVLDEYGGLAGLITLEDLFERIHGQLYDEHDRVERDIIPYDDRSYIVSASTPIATFNEQFSLAIPANRRMITLSGYLIQTYGDVPPAYAIISSPYGSFEILSASKRKIQKVLFRKKQRPKQVTERA